jgi:hydroxymethylglutaryl-CoA synthase
MKPQVNGIHPTHEKPTEPTGIDRFAYLCFHAPTCKVVQKSYARLLYNDYLSSPIHPEFASLSPSVASVSYQDSFASKEVEKTFMAMTQKRYMERVYPGTLVPRNVGNMYTASVFSSLASLLSEIPAERLIGQRIGVFSYGSGLASSFYSLKVVGDPSRLVKGMNLRHRLESRHKVSPQEYDQVTTLYLHSH